MVAARMHQPAGKPVEKPGFVEIVGIVESVALECAEGRLDRQLPGSGMNRNDAAHQIAGVGVGQVTEAVIWPINLQSRPATAGNAVDDFLENSEAGFGLYHRPRFLNVQRTAEYCLAVILAEGLKRPTGLEAATVIAERALVGVLAAGTVLLFRRKPRAQALEIGLQSFDIESGAAFVHRVGNLRAARSDLGCLPAGLR